jgi:guanidinopropionase
MVKKIESYPELADPQLRPRYSGIPTFFRLAHTEQLGEVDIGIIGVPFDGGVTNRTGAPATARERSVTNRRSSAGLIKRPAWRRSISSALPI